MIHKRVQKKEGFKVRSALFLAGTVITVSLFTLGIFLSGWIKVVKNNNLKNLDTLNKALPDFNNQTFLEFQAQVKGLEMEAIGLSNIFDPKYKWIKKDYDLSIHFIEELGRANQFLKIKAQEKGLKYTALDFKEQLPSEKEAVYLLNQLYGLKEVMGLGMDYGVNFKTVSPLEVEELKEAEGLKQAKSRIEMSCPAQGLIDFIIGLNEIVPKVCFQSLALNSQETAFNLVLTLNHLIVDSGIVDNLEISKSGRVDECSMTILKEVALKQENFIYTLRSSDPFFVSLAQQKEGSSQEQTQAPQPLTRFYYRGKAVLRSKEVVVIEDILNQETVFLGLNERIGNFILKDFSDEKVVLLDTDNNQEITIARHTESPQP